MNRVRDLGPKAYYLDNVRRISVCVALMRNLPVHARRYVDSVLAWGKHRRLWNSKCGLLRPLDVTIRSISTQIRLSNDEGQAPTTTFRLRRLSAEKHHVTDLTAFNGIRRGHCAGRSISVYRLRSRQLFRFPRCAAAARPTDPLGGRSRPELSALYGAER